MSVATVEQLQRIRQQILNNIEAITLTPTPNVSDQGRSIQAGTYLSDLFNQLKSIEEQIQAAGGPFKVNVYGRAW